MHSAIHTFSLIEWLFFMFYQCDPRPMWKLYFNMIFTWDLKRSCKIIHLRSCNNFYKGLKNVYLSNLKIKIHDFKILCKTLCILIYYDLKAADYQI